MILFFMMILLANPDSSLCEQNNTNCMLENVEQKKSSEANNVLNLPLQVCSLQPKTGFFRSGDCRTSEQDQGVHTVCAVMTKEFLEFTKANGNDLSSPNPRYAFAGLKPGDSWCLCASRWYEAYKASKAPKVKLGATEETSLKFIPIDVLKELQVK